MVLPRMTRKSTLMVLTSFLLVPCFDAKLGKKSCEKKNTDILLIGAGMAGAAAAHELHKYFQSKNMNDKFVWIEAEDYIGGRMRSMPDFGGPGGPRIELGANWVAGAKGNRMFDLASKFGITNSRSNFGDVVYYENANKVKKVDIPSFPLDCLWEAGFDNVKNPGLIDDDVSAKEYLKEHCGWEATTPLKRAKEFYNMDWEYSESTDSISMNSFPLWTYGYDSQDKSYYVHDQGTVNGLTSPNQGGFNRIAAEYAMAGYDGRNPPLLFSTVVMNIDWENSDDTVKVTTTKRGDSSCTIYHAKRVIPTVSVGVLAKKAIKFLPKIDKKLASMNKVFKLGLYYAFYFKFEEKFWGNNEILNFALQDQNNFELEDPYLCNLWLSLDTTGNSFIRDSNIIMCTLVTEAIKSGTYVFNDEEKLKKQLLAPLEKAFGTLPPVVDFAYFDWENNPFTYGSYENWQVGGSNADYADFVAPLVNSNGIEVVHFAGSATCRRHWGYTHGALYSGERTAKIVLNSLYSADLNTTSICETEPRPGYGEVRFKEPR